jgi:hypothetical protein
MILPSHGNRTNVMRFRINGTEYAGASALDIVAAMRRDAERAGRGSASPRDFLRRAHAELRERIPARELDVSDRLDDETLALSYLCLCDEYGVGQLSDAPCGARTHTA